MHNSLTFFSIYRDNAPVRLAPSSDSILFGGRGHENLHQPISYDKPRVSIITPVFNGRDHIEACMQSVFQQDYGDIEFIVIDGGSTDGTLAILHHYNEQIDYWASGPDIGIYDAMNKGLDVASGHWILFLGSDDRLHDINTVSLAMDDLARATSQSEARLPVLLYGDVLYDNDMRFRSRLGRSLLLHNTVHHQAAFYNRCLFDSFRYDTSKRLVADYELNLLIYLHSQWAIRLDSVVSYCRFGGASSNYSNRSRTTRELNSIRRTYLAFPLHCFIAALLHLRSGLGSVVRWIF